MAKKLYLISILILTLILLGCQEPDELPVPEEIEISEEPGTEEPITLPEGSEANLSCTHNENCTEGKLCIEGECQILAALYETNETCQKCRFNKVKILTSDGETYSLPPGQGSYTAAGGLDWTILSSPGYCHGEEVTVPINILKRNYGEIFSDSIIMLKVGKTSGIIKHPFMKRVAFTLRVIKIEEDCS